MKITAIITLTLFISLSSFSQDSSVRKKHFNIKKGVSIGGYDPVSYFSGIPQKGSEEYQYAYKGVTYYFASDEHLKKFKVSPVKYEPQYGGWCAYAIGQTGDKVKIDPKTYQITDGKLYLFYNFKGLNTLNSWEEDQSNLQKKADKNWSKTIH